MQYDNAIIYHNPACGASRNTLAILRNAGIEPHRIEYLKTPPVRTLLEQLIARAGLTPRTVRPERSAPDPELGLADPARRDGPLLALA